jgi:hypothetical protein
LMLGLDSLTGVVKGNILGNISLRSILPIGYLEIMVHLISSGVNGISELVASRSILSLNSLI